MNETIVHLKPQEQWRAGLTREALITEMDEKLRMPGVTNIWTQPIINRIEMLTTGIRTQVGIKIFGNDLKQLEASQGRSPKMSKRSRVPSMFIPNRSAVRRTSISRSIARRRHDTASTLRVIQDTIEKGIGETNLSVTIEGRRTISGPRSISQSSFAIRPKR